MDRPRTQVPETPVGGGKPVRICSPCCLTFACVGLGHLYAGREPARAVFFLLSLLFVPATAVAAVLPPSRFALGLLLAMVALALLTALLALVDVVRCARRARMWPRERTLWRPGLVALFLTVGIAFPWGRGSCFGRGAWKRSGWRAAAWSRRSWVGTASSWTSSRTCSVRRGAATSWCSGTRTTGTASYIKRVVGLPGNASTSSATSCSSTGSRCPRRRRPSTGPARSGRGRRAGAGWCTALRRRPLPTGRRCWCRRTPCSWWAIVAERHSTVASGVRCRWMDSWARW